MESMREAGTTTAAPVLSFLALPATTSSATGYAFLAAGVALVALSLVVPVPASDDKDRAQERSALLGPPGGSRLRTGLVAVAAALPCFIDGIHFAAASGVLYRLDPDRDLHYMSRGLFVASYQFGHLASWLLLPRLTDALGRKRTLLLVAAGQLVTLLAMAAVPEHLQALSALRFVAGVCFAQMVAPVYLAEVAPPSLRGYAVSFVEMLTVFGSLAAFALHVALQDHPLWVLWMVVGGLAGAACVATALLPAEPAREAEPEGDAPPMSPADRRGLQLACTLGFLQQCTGEEALFGFTTSIAEDMGLQSPRFFGLILGTVTLLCNLVANGVVDVFGRRIMLISGMMGMGVAWGSAALMLFHGRDSYQVLACILSYELVNSLTLGPLFFVVAAEVLSTPQRARGLGLALLASRVTATVMVLTFELKNHYLSLAGTFAIYAALLFAGAGYIQASLPETKGKRLEDIQAMLSPDGHRD